MGEHMLVGFPSMNEHHSENHCWRFVIYLFSSPTFMLPITLPDVPLNSRHVDSFTSCYHPAVRPDFSEAVSSKRLYLPGQTQNQYPQHKHRTQEVQQIGHWLVPCSDYKVEMPQKKSSFSQVKSGTCTLQRFTRQLFVHLLLLMITTKIFRLSVTTTQILNQLDGRLYTIKAKRGLRKDMT